MRNVIETRTTPDGFTRRRYESPTGQRHTTIEVPLDLWKRLNAPGRAKDRSLQWLRTQDRLSKRNQAVNLHNSGWSVRRIAEHLETSRRSVQRWIAQMKTPPEGGASRSVVPGHRSTSTHRRISL